MKSFRFNRAIFSAGAIALGIVLLIWPAGSLLIIAKCVGIILAVGGIAAGVMYYRDHESAVKSFLLVIALVMLICGVVIFLHPEELVKLFPTIVGILVMISGLINLGETFVLSRSKYGKWWISLIIAVITIALGVFIINKAFSLAALITRIAGGVLIFDGASHIWVISRISKTASEAGSTVDGSAVQVNTEPADSGAAQAKADPASDAAVDAAGTRPEAGAAAGQAKAESAHNAADTESSTSDTPEASDESTEPEKDTVSDPESGHNSRSEANSGESSVTGTAPPSREQDADDDEDSVPEYMMQAEQETDYLSYSNRNSLKNEEPGSGEAEDVQ